MYYYNSKVEEYIDCKEVIFILLWQKKCYKQYNFQVNDFLGEQVYINVVLNDGINNEFELVGGIEYIVVELVVDGGVIILFGSEGFVCISIQVE